LDYSCFNFPTLAILKMSYSRTNINYTGRKISASLSDVTVSEEGKMERARGEHGLV
jgi:hypothetical protein